MKYLLFFLCHFGITFNALAVKDIQAIFKDSYGREIRLFETGEIEYLKYSYKSEFIKYDGRFTVDSNRYKIILDETPKGDELLTNNRGKEFIVLLEEMQDRLWILKPINPIKNTPSFYPSMHLIFFKNSSGTKMYNYNDSDNLSLGKGEYILEINSKELEYWNNEKIIWHTSKPTLNYNGNTSAQKYNKYVLQAEMHLFEGNLPDSHLAFEKAFSYLKEPLSFDLSNALSVSLKLGKKEFAKQIIRILGFRGIEWKSLPSKRIINKCYNNDEVRSMRMSHRKLLKAHEFYYKYNAESFIGDLSKKDQKARKKKNYEPDLIRKIDFTNADKLSSYYDAYGIEHDFELMKNNITSKFSAYIIHHHLRYYPSINFENYLEQAFIEGKIRIDIYSYLMDLRNDRLGTGTFYGTPASFSIKGEIYRKLLPEKILSEINARRERIGLFTLEQQTLYEKKAFIFFKSSNNKAYLKRTSWSTVRWTGVTEDDAVNKLGLIKVG